MSNETFVAWLLAPLKDDAVLSLSLYARLRTVSTSFRDAVAALRPRSHLVVRCKACDEQELDRILAQVGHWAQVVFISIQQHPCKSQGPLDAAKVCRVIAQRKQLEHIAFEGVFLGSAPAAYHLNFITTMPLLTSLDLRGNFCCHRAAENLARLLPECKNLKNLWLGSNSLYKDACQVYCMQASPTARFACQGIGDAFLRVAGALCGPGAPPEASESGLEPQRTGERRPCYASATCGALPDALKAPYSRQLFGPP